jgi:ABC-2 type transport system ATP-binding protein
VIYRGELIAEGTPRQLKTGHMSETVLELDCGRPSEAMTVIERIPTVREAALFGRGLHAVTADAAAAIPAIRAALAAAGLPLTRIEPVTPTLEDVFVSLIESRDRAAGAQEEVRR